MIFAEKCIETDITTVCRHSCAGCDHLIPITTEKRVITPAQFKHDLDCLRGIIRCKDYRILGGEPTLHPQIVEMLEVVNGSGIADNVQVWTSGENVRNLPEMFWCLIDELVYSYYPSADYPMKEVEWMREMCKAHNKKFTVIDRSTFCKPIFKAASSPEVTLERYQNCVLRGVYSLNNGFFYKCCTSPFQHRILLGLPEGTDGIAVDGLTEEKLITYLNDETPLKSCPRCAGYTGERHPWHEAKRDKWMEESCQ